MKISHKILDSQTLVLHELTKLILHAYTISSSYLSKLKLETS